MSPPPGTTTRVITLFQQWFSLTFPWPKNEFPWPIGTSYFFFEISDTQFMNGYQNKNVFSFQLQLQDYIYRNKNSSVFLQKKIQDIIIIFHDFSWPWLFSMTFQSSKMVLLNSTTFQEEWSPWTTVGPQFSGELFSRHLTEQQPSAVIHLNAPRKVYPYVAYVSPLPNGGTGVSTGSSHSMHYYNYCSLCQMQVYPTCTAVACFCSVFSFQFA